MKFVDGQELERIVFDDESSIGLKNDVTRIVVSIEIDNSIWLEVYKSETMVSKWNSRHVEGVIVYSAEMTMQRLKQ